MLLLLLLSAPAAHARLPDDALVALRRGDCPAAVRALQSTDSVEAALAKARCGHAEGAEATLGRGDPLEPYLRLALAEALLPNKPGDARRLLDGVTLPGAAGLRVRLVRGQALVALGESLDARPELRALLDGPHRAEALYWLAKGAEDRGDTASAVDAYQSLWAKEITSPFSLQAAERLAGLGAPVPDFSDEAGRALALQRARALVKAYRAPEAIPLYDGITKATGEQSAAWTYELAMALFKAKDYPRSMEAMARLKPTEPGTRGGADTLFHYALGTSRTGDYAAAAVYYKRLVELYPGTSTADTASFKIAYLDYDAGNLEAAIPLFEAHLKRYPSTSHADEAYWFLGWSHYRLGHLDEAKRWLDRLLQEKPKSSLAPGGLYWKARILGLQGDAAAEREALARVLNSYPNTSHAWFAAKRLGVRFEGLGDAQIPSIPKAFADAHPEIGQAQALADAGQLDWARERMLEVKGAAQSADRTTRLAVAHALIELGAYQDAQALARQHCAAPWSEGADPVALRACYPRPEYPVVAEAAAAHGLNPLLPYAIMTAESALDPSVTSIAGARGLMQLMPELAAELHAGVLKTPYDPDQLYVAGYNAYMGTTELGRLHEGFGGGAVQPSLPLVIAGYNGGAEAVQRWLDGYEAPPDADWFAENVSYTETRRYVRRVLGFLMNYLWVYGDPE